MAISVDPQGRELRALERLTRWRNREVLEVGCGEGRLTARLATLGCRICAMDTDPSLVRRARRALGARRRQSITFRVGSAERLPYRALEFDAVVFSWAL